MFSFIIIIIIIIIIHHNNAELLLLCIIIILVSYPRKLFLSFVLLYSLSSEILYTELQTPLDFCRWRVKVEVWGWGRGRGGGLLGRSRSRVLRWMGRAKEFEETKHYLTTLYIWIVCCCVWVTRRMHLPHYDLELMILLRLTCRRSYCWLSFGLLWNGTEKEGGGGEVGVRWWWSVEGFSDKFSPLL